jgi:thioredoxin
MLVVPGRTRHGTITTVEESHMATIALGAENFESTVSSNDIVLVDFWASWCGPCRMFAPIYEQAATAHPDIVFGKVDTEAEQALASAAQITSIPTLMAFKGGTLVFSQPGALPAAELEQVVAAIRELDVEAALAERQQTEKQTEQKRSA